MTDNKIVQMRNDYNTNGLFSLIKEFPYNVVMAEIGCYAGESTEMFFNSGKIKQLYAIDPWKSGYDENLPVAFSDFDLVEKSFDERMKNKNVVKLKMTMEEAFNSLPELDIIYIDGDHRYEYVIKDIQLALKKIKKNGIICGHDYIIDDIEVIRAVNNIFGHPDKVFSDASWMVKIKNK